MAIYFRAADRREVPASEALDARGVLKHGYGQRVPHSMRDAAPRFSDARSFWDAHRDGLLVVDARRIGGTEGNKPGYRVLDNDLGRAERAAAYAEVDAYRRDAWRNLGDAKKKEDPPPVTGRSRCPECDGRGVVHGKYCQGCGGDGWVDDDENNENNEDDNGETTSDRRMRDVQAVSAAHQQNMAKLYQQIADDVSQRWRER
jgi:hypothetical protein